MKRFGLFLIAAIAGATSAFAFGAGPPPGSEFQFSPVPRRREEPETDVLCKAIRQECPAFSGKTEIDADIGYDELYDVSGRLVGVRLTKSTGCAPLDEDSLLSRRSFRMEFHHEGQPDLEDIHAEVGPGVNPEAVRIVKRSATSLNIGCN
jgi:hypothetical protein